MLFTQVKGQTQSKENIPQLQISNSTGKHASSSIDQPQLKMKTSVKTVKTKAVHPKSKKADTPKLKSHSQASSTKQKTPKAK